MGELIGFPPEPPPEMGTVDTPAVLVPFTPAKVVGTEPEAIPGFIEGALKQQYEPVLNDAGEQIGQRLVFRDDAGTEHPAP